MFCRRRVGRSGLSKIKTDLLPELLLFLICLTVLSLYSVCSHLNCFDNLEGLLRSRSVPVPGSMIYIVSGCVSSIESKEDVFASRFILFSHGRA